MSLTPLIPSMDDMKRIALASNQGAPSLASLRAPQGPMPSLGPLPSLPQQAAPQMPTLRPLVTSPRQQQEQGLQGKISAYENPSAPKPGFWHSLGRVAAKVGNIAGDIVAPGTMSLIPGTDLYKQGEHARNVGELESLQKQDQTEQSNFADNTLRGAQTREADARADSLENPPDKPDKFSYQQTDHGLMRIDNETGEATPVTFNGQVLQPKVPVEKEVNAKEQLQRQLVEAENKGDNATVQKLQQQLKDIDPMGQQRLDLTVRGQDVAAGARDQKSDVATKQATFKAFQPSLDSAERFNVMAKNYEDAIKNHDQQAMLSLLANHLGMTMGLQKGSRLTRDIIREAQESRAWLQGLAAKFDKDGILTGVTLTPEQMQQMVHLGRGRFSEDTTKARSESRYLGSGDDGPDRVPNKSTMNFYLSLANGDVPKAKQLATEDGWTVK